MAGPSPSACYHRNLPNVDLHCHSTASDGLLGPAEVMRLAAARSVSLISLTDHDETAGLAEASAAAAELNMTFVPGVEVSVTWRAQTIHVVGLGFDAKDAGFAHGLAQLRAGREHRARRMAQELDRIGIHGSFEGASAYAVNPRLLSRTHFARFLKERRFSPDTKSVFQHYLARGKPGYVAHEWATLQQALRWICGSGGVAVIAHPGRYKLSNADLDSLLGAFRDAGGRAIEVISGQHTPRQSARFARLARRFGLAASLGSDYHGPGESRLEPGRLPELPSDLTPVWNLL